MFYFKEFLYRLNYLFIVFLIIFFYFYSIKEYLFTLLISNLSHKKNFYLQNFELSFIINTPNELINVELIFCLITTLVFFYPIFLKQIFMFLKSALKNQWINFLKKYSFFLLTFFFVFNYTLIFYIFPHFWSYIEILNMLLMSQSTINIEYEPNLLLYLKSLWICFIIINFVIFFIIIIFFSIFLSLELKTFIKRKKILNITVTLLNFVVLAFIFETDVLVTIVSLITVLVFFYFFKKILYLNFLFLYIKNFHQLNYEIKKNSKIY